MSVEMISAWGDTTGKHAEIIKTEQGFEVNIFKANEYLPPRLHQYSESYAEKVAENWTLGVVEYGDSKWAVKDQTNDHAKYQTNNSLIIGKRSLVKTKKTLKNTSGKRPNQGEK